MNNQNDIESKIEEFFEENFEALRMESGHSLSPEAKIAALQQVQLYWQRLRHVAEKVTDTEVKLNLPEQQTPHGSTFGIEGVVDIVRENDQTVMYDVKTHDADDIQANVADYQKQLNVYAHIWQNLRGQRLDETAVISTAFPESVKIAFQNGDDTQLQRELQQWQPLIPIPFSTNNVETTIREFGETVDKIEDGEFAPPPLTRLKSRSPGMKTIFAVQVCRNCDARFSCSAYRAYAQSSGGAAESTFRQLFFEETLSETEHDDRVMAGLETLESAEGENIG